MLLGLGASSKETHGEDVFASYLRNNYNTSTSTHYDPTAHVGNGIKFRCELGKSSYNDATDRILG